MLDREKTLSSSDSRFEYKGENEEQLRNMALENLWIYGRQPSSMAETGEPTLFVEGSGSKIKDINGKQYIDALAGLAVVNIGHGRKEMAEAVYTQMVNLAYVPSGTTSIVTSKLANKLAEITPGSLSRCFFTSGGSESVETAIKIARAYQKRRGESRRYKIICRKGSYHGSTALTLWLGGSPNQPDYEPMYPGIVHAPQPNPYRCEYGASTPEECAYRCAKAVEDLILFHGPETVCAFIGEPIAAPPGVAIPGDAYWPMIRDMCDKYGVVMIVDEVICGFGRTGKMFGMEHFGVVPDIITIAKGMTSGYVPMGAAIASKEIADVFIGDEDKSFGHIFTYGGQPIAAAAALKNIEILEREHLVDNADEMGVYLLKQFEELKKRHAIVGDVRGRGLLIALDIVKDQETKDRWPTEAKLRERLRSKFNNNGVWLRGSDPIILTPPLCISLSECEDLVEITHRVLSDVEKELGVYE